MISTLFKHLFEFIFPAECIICTGLSSTNLCPECLTKIDLNDEQNISWALSLYSYKPTSMKAVIRHLKNFPDIEIIDQLCEYGYSEISAWFEKVISEFPNHRFMCLPIPLHTSRYSERGYNQAECIAESFAKIIRKNFSSVQIEINTDILKKEKLTKKQALITDREERFKNVSHAFSIDRKFLPRNSDRVVYIIIDDVSTTGGTLTEVRRILEPYTDKVFALTLGH